MRSVSILGVRFSNITMCELISHLKSDLSSGRQVTLAFSNPEFLVEARGSAFLKKYLNEVSYNLADGFGVVAASKLYGESLPERVTGTDFVYRIAQFSHETGASIFFYGGKPGVALEAKKNLERIYPNVRIIGVLDGYTNSTENIIYQVNKVRPNFLMVCLGNPVQERFIQEYRHHLEADIVFGNGGALDFCSGQVARAPRWMQKYGMEWLYRLKSDFTLKRIRRQSRLFSYVIFVFFEFLDRLYRNWRN